MTIMMNILNYAVRGLILAFGIVLMLGIIPIPNTEPFVVKVTGLIFVLWGILRIVTYRSHLRQMKEEEEEL